MVSRLSEDFDFHYNDTTYMWISIPFQGRHVVGPLIVGPHGPPRIVGKDPGADLRLLHVRELTGSRTRTDSFTFED